MSVGNVAQLAADLLIASLKLDRVGVFDPRHLVPVVGAREDGAAGLTTPIERKSPPTHSVERLDESYSGSIRRGEQQRRSFPATFPCTQGRSAS